MKQVRIPAVFMRGGTSNAIVFHARDLPDDRALWDEIFLAAIGSPDPYGRQLNGMGGGISSLSKICVIGPPSRDDADIDYTFAQVSVRDAAVDYSGNCGNMSSGMGPFAVDEGLVDVSGDKTIVRIHNTNTRKIIHSHFALDDGMAAVDGDYELPGVAGTGAPVRLEFRDPGGASTGTLLPTGNPVDTLDVPGLGPVEASCVDAANACVFVDAAVLGLKGNELPEAVDANREAMAHLANIRRAASVAMGITGSLEEADKVPSIPKVSFVSAAQDATLLTGEAVAAGDGDLTGRMISVGNCHRALPLTGASCMAVAAKIPGSIPNRLLRPLDGPAGDVRIIQPSGVITVGAKVDVTDSAPVADYIAVYRTARRLFDGSVYVPASKVPGLLARRDKAA